MVENPITQDSLVYVVQAAMKLFRFTAGQYTPRASTYLPVKQIDDGIWIDKAYMPSGWTIEQGILMVPDALLVSSEQHQRVLQEQRQSMEYMEAHAALEAVKWACIQSERRLNGKVT